MGNKRCSAHANHCGANSQHMSTDADQICAIIVIKGLWCWDSSTYSLSASSRARHVKRNGIFDWFLLIYALGGLELAYIGQALFTLTYSNRLLFADGGHSRQGFLPGQPVMGSSTRSSETRQEPGQYIPVRAKLEQLVRDTRVHSSHPTVGVVHFMRNVSGRLIPSRVELSISMIILRSCMFYCTASASESSSGCANAWFLILRY